MITLLIPTMNRSDFLIRQLNYYRDIVFRGHICIGDSSNTKHIERNKRAIKALQGNLNIVYQEYPHLNNAECVQRLLDFVSTSYAALVPDDDFLVPAALEQCALFLDKHPDYSAAHGMGVVVRLQSSGAYGKVRWVCRYRQPVIEGEKASQRLLSHLSNYSVTLFSVHRVESWRMMYRDISLLTDRTFAMELLPCCLSVLQGKVKELDCLYLVRQSHGQRYLLPNQHDWINSPNWSSSYQVFCHCLARELARQDRVSMDKAEEVVKQAFQSYLAHWSSTSNRLREAIQAFPGTHQVWHTLQSLNLRRRDGISLAALLHPSSSYHADFMPVYRAVTAVSASTENE